MCFEAEEFGNRLRNLRTARGMTQEFLADELGVCWDHLSRIERGTKNCSIDLIIEIAAYFSVTTDYLLLGENMDISEAKEKLQSVIGELTEIANNLE